jgi:hypothetical protein
MIHITSLCRLRVDSEAISICRLYLFGSKLFARAHSFLVEIPARRAGAWLPLAVSDFFHRRCIRSVLSRFGPAVRASGAPVNFVLRSLFVSAARPVSAGAPSELVYAAEASPLLRRGVLQFQSRVELGAADSSKFALSSVSLVPSSGMGV